jgi:hypothetical protein
MWLEVALVAAAAVAVVVVVVVVVMMAVAVMIVVIHNECNYTCHFRSNLDYEHFISVVRPKFRSTFVNEQSATDSRLQATRYTK